MPNQQLGMLAPGMDPRQPAPGIAPRPQPMWPQQPVGNNALSGFSAPAPVLSEQDALRLVLQALAR